MARKKTDTTESEAKAVDTLDAISAPQHSALIPFSLEVRKAIKAPDAIEREELDPITKAEVKDKETDTDLKRVYAYGMIGILGAQLLIMNIVFVAVGCGWIKYEDSSYLKIFMGGTLAEVFGVILVITRYLFSKNGTSSSSKAPRFLPTTKRD